MSIDVLIEVWEVALILFLIRLVTMIIGSFAGGILAGESRKFILMGWMPFVTQAGVGLGLAAAVAQGFPTWGSSFASLIIAIIVLNQLVGPPLFKYALGVMGEARAKAHSSGFEGNRDALIFGLESQSVALAKQLTDHGWQVKIATFKQDVKPEDYPDLTIEKIDEISPEALEKLEAQGAEAIITLLTDEENYKICEIAYEKIGTRDLVVRLNHRYNLEKFHKLGCLVVDPSTAMVSLMDHLVRSPQAASLILGLQEGQDTLDVEITSPDVRGLPLRDLKLPPDIIVLSIKRGGQMIITHGYSRLRLGDIITMVGSRKSLSEMTLRLEK
jgi:Trk K+ transport system NAD-binding subunit